MMTKGTFFLNETLRKGAPMVTDIGQGCFMARSRLAFPQGLQFIYKVFQGRPLADVYSHGYFIEKQSNPSQPSPQFHLTEELQGIMRVMKGLIYMQDISSRIDNAMTVVRDPDSSSEEEAWVMYNPIELDEKTLPAFRQRLTGSNAYLNPKIGVDTEMKTQKNIDDAIALREKIKNKVKTIVVPSRQTFGQLAFWMSEFPNAKVIASGTEIPANVAAELFAGKTEEEKQLILKRFTFVSPAAVLTPITPQKSVASSSSIPSASESTKAASSSSDLDAPPQNLHNLSRYAISSTNEHQPITARDSVIDPSNGIIPIDNTTLLRRVPGDAITNELVLLHKPSRCMACTDLFHGAYADFDPLNTWMCRAWFKFNRNGDYKDARVLPLFRRRQIEAQNGGAVEKGGKGIGPVAEFVRELVTSDEHFGGGHFDIICHSHGTPPSRASAKELLMAQYDLLQMELPAAPEIDVTHQNLFSVGRV